MFQNGLKKLIIQKLKKNGAEYNMESLAEIVNSKPHIDLSIDAMNVMDAKNKKTLVFCSTIEHADNFAQALRENNYYVQTYHSGNTKKDNERIMDAFRNNTFYTGSADELESKSLFDEEKSGVPVKCLVSVGKISIGFSVEDINLAVLARSVGVRSLFYQMCGRARRIHPSKTHGEILDLGQNLSRHGFPEDTYRPPQRTGDQELDREAIDEATLHLRLEHLAVTLESDTPEPVSRDKYELKLEEIKTNKKRLSNLSVKELYQKLELEEEPMVCIAIAVVLFDKIHNKPMNNKYGRPSRGYIANNGKQIVDFVNPGSIEWISELWNKEFPKQEPFYQRRYIKSLHTRIKNLINQKGSIWGLHYFISWLIEQDNYEIEVTEPASKSDYEIEYEELGLTEEDIPW